MVVVNRLCSHVEVTHFLNRAASTCHTRLYLRYPPNDQYPLPWLGYLEPALEVLTITSTNQDWILKRRRMIQNGHCLAWCFVQYNDLWQDQRTTEPFGGRWPSYEPRSWNWIDIYRYISVLSFKMYKLIDNVILKLRVFAVQLLLQKI